MTKRVPLEALPLEDARLIRSLVTRRLVTTDAILARLMPIEQPIDAPMMLTSERDAAMAERAEAEDEEKQVNSGLITVSLLGRAHECRDRRLVRIPDTSVWMTFQEVLDRTGAATVFRWVARAGNLERGVRIMMPDIVQWTLLPAVSGDQLRIAAVQLALSVLTASVRQNFEGFFADHEDFQVNLAAPGTGPTTWDPTLDLTS